MSEQTWTFAEAWRRCDAASRRQESAEESMREASAAYAEAEERYRLALARAIVTAHNDDKIAWTVCPDIARGQVDVARLRKERDIAEGVRDAMTQAAWRRAADRKDAQRFADWSQRRELAEGAGQIVGPSMPVTYGAKRAA
jgi:hypothetical protein